jgi:hypothetical protein
VSQVHIHIPSFNAGELSPLLGSRFGVEKVQSGCRRLRNFIIHTHGPAFRRPGMEYMGPSMGDGAPSRLMGFNFSTTTGFILEFHPSGLQVWDGKGPVTLKSPVSLEPYSAQDCAELQIAQVNDVCYIAHPNHPPRKLVRNPEDEWVISDVEWKWPPLGDEHVREGNTASGSITELFSVRTQTWPEFVVAKGTTVNFKIIDTPALNVLKKKATLEFWDSPNSKWVIARTLKWQGTAMTVPAIKRGVRTRYRMIYLTPDILLGGAKLEASWSEEEKDKVTLDLGVAQPEINSFVSVPKGDWQATVRMPDVDIPTNARIHLQKKVKDRWANYGKPIPLRRGETSLVTGEKLEAPEDRRFNWDGFAVPGGTATIDQVIYPSSDDTTIMLDNKGGEDVKMTASAPLFKATHEGSFWQLTHFASQSKVAYTGGGRTIAAKVTNAILVQGKWEVHTYGSWTTTVTLERAASKEATEWETVNSWTSRNDRNVIANGEETQPMFMRLKIEAGTANQPDTPENSPHRPRWELITVEGKIHGLVKITKVNGPFDEKGRSETAQVTVIRSVHSAGEGSETAMWTEGAWSKENGYPRTVAFHGQRLWFGGTKKEPLRLWGSVVNDYEDFTRSSLSDAGVSFTPAAQQQNALQWMASHGTELILGSTGDEWTVGGGVEGGPIAPTSVMVQRRSAYGSSHLQALMLGEVIVFVQRGGQKLRQVAPRASGIVWSAADLTVLAEHIARAGVKQLAIMNFPASILWAVTNDGKLLGMTFEQEQNVFGWHVHDTDGRVESVAVVYGMESDEVWLEVERNGKRGIERLDPRVFARQFERYQSLIYLDAARRLEVQPKDPPEQVVTGLGHLEGREVQVLGDGAVLNPVRVVNGMVTLEKAVRTAIVGLPYLSELQPMRLEIPMQDGTAQNRMWRSTRVGLFLHHTIGGEIADGPEARFEKLQFRRISTPMDSAPALFSGQMETAIESRAREGADIIVRQTEPLPMNIGSITLKGDIYGE